MTNFDSFRSIIIPLCGRIFNPVYLKHFSRQQLFTSISQAFNIEINHLSTFVQWKTKIPNVVSKYFILNYQTILHRRARFFCYRVSFRASDWSINFKYSFSLANKLSKLQLLDKIKLFYELKLLLIWSLLHVGLKLSNQHLRGDENVGSERGCLLTTNSIIVVS